METQTASKTLWAVDPAHSEMVFKVRHMMISTVTGHFNSFDVKAWSYKEDFSDVQVEVSVDIDSIDTKSADRDQHLKSNDFFNAEAYPKMIFKSKSFDGNSLVGDLSIREVTKEVSMDVTFNGIAQDPYGQTKAGFEITGEINRKDFNLSWNAVTEAGKIVVSDKVKLALEIQLVKQ